MTKSAVLWLAMGLAAVPLMASAQSEDTIEVVETRTPMEVVLINADFLRPEDPTNSIFGGTTQFLDGERILIELALIEPISSDELKAIKEASADGEARFLCEEATLYLANGWHVGDAKGCVVSHPTEAGTP